MAGRLVLAALLIPAIAAAEGEHSPMLGGNVVAHDDERAGVNLDMTWWAWRVGVSFEGSMLWRQDESRATVVGGSLRFLAFDALIESLLEPRFVELGLEVHGVAERWMSEDRTRYGVGVALRLRGGSDYDLSSLIAESRVFVRVMASLERNEVIARMTEPLPPEDSPVMVLVGLGVAFGSGRPDYLDRFRMEPFSPAAKRLANGWLE